MSLNRALLLIGAVGKVNPFTIGAGVAQEDLKLQAVQAPGPSAPRARLRISPLRRARTHVGLAPRGKAALYAVDGGP